MCLCVCPLQRPPFSINLFSSEEVNCVLKYIHDSYVRHHKLYKYIFTPQVRRSSYSDCFKQVLLSFIFIILDFNPVRIYLERIMSF